jgi:hypothetical protein
VSNFIQTDSAIGLSLMASVGFSWRGIIMSLQHRSVLTLGRFIVQCARRQ